MLKQDLKKLVLSLSGPERKYFKSLYTTNGPDKDYMILFDMMYRDDVKEPTGDIETQFKAAHPKKSFDNTAAYLYRILTDMLVQMRIDHDNWFYSHHCLMKAQLCFERSIPERGLKELNKIKNLAEERQDNLMHYTASRMELSRISEASIPDFSEQQLVDMQMKAKRSLQNIRQIQEHYSLFELLSHRLRAQDVHTGDQANKKLNDLILGELSITTRGTQQSFESKKLHLLFQGFFLSRIGDYSSALKIFKDLNVLFEQHPQLWSWPPYDYLSALDGILDSLRSIGYYEEMDFFIDKIRMLSTGNYPDHFIQAAIRTLLIYEFNAILGKKAYPEALTLIEKNKLSLPKGSQTINSDKHLELLFFLSASYFFNKDLQKANKFIALGILQDKQGSGQLIYRVSRLLRMIIHFEMGTHNYLEYEIRTHKRLFNKSGRSYELERLLFQILLADPRRSTNAKMKLIWNKERELKQKINRKADEQDLLKYFDFFAWFDSLKAKN
ncbi:MAG: hypothetical protein EOO88_02095 [Pedobacter sp.]|nr:MAG: hypothetical protein EOO88_02095 [Pedobacter sp.]